MTDVPGSRSPQPSLRISVPTELEGRVILPGDPGYEAGRQLYDAGYDRHPAAIVLARDTADVLAALRLADDTGLPFTVRSGGHSTTGLSVADDSVLIDLAGLDGIEIDAERETVRIGGGVRAGAVIAALHPLGFTVPFGDTGSVGVGGLTLGGGVGWLVRKYGMAIDSLLGVEIVVASGEVLEASATEHPDLFWAVRGGGGNFGIVTRFDFRLRAIDTVLHGDVIVRATPEALGRLVDVLADAPDDLTVMPLIMLAPPIPAIPEAWHGQLVAYLSFAHAGPPAEDDRMLELLRSVGESVTSGVERKPYPALFPPPTEERWSFAVGTLFVDTLDAKAIEIIERRLAAPSSSDAIVTMRVFGGAYARVPNDATAYAHRDRRATIILITVYDDPADHARHAAWTTAFEAELVAAGCGSGAYLNFLGTDGDLALRAAYPPATLARLRDVKRRYDPDNRFRSNLNIEPAPASA